MSLLRLQHIGIAVKNLKDACERFEALYGLKSCDFRDDQGKGMQYDARILLGNECWLHLVQNWDERARVNKFLRQRGEGLEHIAIETDDIEGDVMHLREIGVPIFEDRIFPANDGYEAFVFPDQLPGLTVELIQGHETSWVYPEEALGKPISETLKIVGLQHLGLAVKDVQHSCERFEHLFGLEARDIQTADPTRAGSGSLSEAHIPFNNECWLHLVHDQDESPTGEFLRQRGEGLDHLSLQTNDLDADVERLVQLGLPFYGGGINESEEGRSATVYPDQLAGITVELVQPYGAD